MSSFALIVFRIRSNEPANASNVAGSLVAL
jgi:hypothetical protein